MMNSQLGCLDDSTKERLLQDIVERLVPPGSSFVVEDEVDARTLIANVFSDFAPSATSVGPDDIAPPTHSVDHYIDGLLRVLASDTLTVGLVSSSLNDLPEETQMVAEPVTVALVLAAVVALLQTRFAIRVSRKNGKNEFSFSVVKDSASNKTIAEMITALRNILTK